MNSRYKAFTYGLTTDPEFLNDKFGITPELYFIHQKRKNTTMLP